MSDQTLPDNSETMYKDSPTTYARDAAVITPNDTTELDPWPRNLRIGGGGTLAVTTIRGVDITFTNIQDGELLPLAVSKVKATTTDCTNIVAFYG